MTSRLVSYALLILAALTPTRCAAPVKQRFPEWTVRPLPMDGVWEHAEDVLVGDVRNIRLAGTQKVKHPLRPAPNPVDRIYWCEADFIARSSIKGRVPPPGTKFLWGSPRPGCQLSFYEQLRWPASVTRVWFCREEQGYLRPVADAGSLMFVSFKADWDSSPEQDPQTRFATLLLTPSAESTNRETFKQTFFASASTACLILGRAQCVNKIRTVAELHDPALTSTACDFLRTQFREKCLP